jgi:type VI secretion system protein ImpH
MASADRDTGSAVDLLHDLAKEPYKFGFYEAMRHLECFYRQRPRLGRSARPGDDSIRLGQTPSLQFAPASLSEFVTKPGVPPQLKVLFFGVFGANGPLPLHLTEYALNRIRHAKDFTLADFADMFHHRLLTLFYRAWADKEPTVHLDRPEQDRFASYVGALLGLTNVSLRHRDALPDHTKLHFAAHFGCHTGHSDGLLAILNDFFQVSIKIQEFVGEWLVIPKDSYCYLDGNRTTGQLGKSAVIGTQSWQCQHKFRIIIGPLTQAEYESFLPTGSRLKNIRALVNNYVGFEFVWDINLILKKQEVPTVKLGHYGQLGWTSWLQAHHRSADVNDLHLATETLT